MHKIDEKLTELTKTVEKLTTAIRAEAKTLDAASKAATGGKIMPVTMCAVSSRINGSIAAFAPNSTYGPVNWRVAVENARKEAEAARINVEAQHTANAEAIANNQAVVANVKLIMTNLGIPESITKWGYATPRARKMTSTTTIAGYISDLAAVCKTSDCYDSCKRQIDDFERRIAAYEKENQGKEAAKAAEEQRERAQREKLTLLGALAHKYSCAADYDEIINAMASKNKYFGLAYWLERNRINWNDGPDRAETGLNYFNIESDEDSKIADEVREQIENWDGDGRVFRDMEYGYGFLYSKVEADIMGDFEKLRNAGLTPDD